MINEFDELIAEIKTQADFALPNVLFEINDDQTRETWVACLYPFLSNLPSRGFETLHICDRTNNTPTIIDSNKMVSDIYIRKKNEFTRLRLTIESHGLTMEEVRGLF